MQFINSFTPFFLFFFGTAFQVCFFQLTGEFGISARKCAACSAKCKMDGQLDLFEKTGFIVLCFCATGSCFRTVNKKRFTFFTHN